MSWIDIGLLFLQYGPSILVLLIIIILIKPVYRFVVNTKNRLKECEVKMDSMHDNCHIPVGSMKKVEKEIKGLKKKDHKIELKIVGMCTTLDSNNVMISQLHNHFLQKGLDSATNQEDS